MRTVIIFAMAFAFGAGAQPTPAPQLPLTPQVASQLQAFCAAWPGSWTLDISNQGSITTITGRPTTPPGAPDFDVHAIRDKLARLHDRDVVKSPAPQFDTDADERTIGNLRQYTFWQQAENRRIDGGAITVTVSADGRSYYIVLSQVPQRLPPKATRAPGSAVRAARAGYFADLAAEVAVRHGATVLDEAVAAGASAVVTAVAEGPPDAIIAVGGVMRRVQRVVVTAAIAAENGRTLLDRREYAIDATTGDETAASVVRVLHLLAFADSPAKLFDPHPMFTLGTFNVSPFDPQLACAYIPENLGGLDSPQNKLVFFTGKHVRIVEEEGPNFCDGTPQGTNVDLCLPHIALADVTAVPDFTSFTRGSPVFAAAMAYFHLDRIQLYVSNQLSLPVPIVNIDIASAEVPGFGHFCDCITQKSPNGFIGLARDGSKYLVEDATDIAHEYGHFLLAQGTNKFFGTARTAQNKSEAVPIGEGFGDYWAFSTFYDVSKNTQFENCLGPWGNGYDCERRNTDMPNHSLFQESYDGHINGIIWSGTLADVFRTLGAVREVADTVILQGHYLAARLPDAPTMVSVADAIVFAAGAHTNVNADDLCAVFQKHGLDPSLCDPHPRPACSVP